MIFIFRNRTIFWDILKWNRGQIKWDGGSSINKNNKNALHNIFTINPKL